MAELLSLEESAQQLGVSEAVLRQWIKRGLARAARRAGEYILRQSEVDRLRIESSTFAASGGDVDLIDTPSAEIRRPRALPPRSASNPDSYAGERDRRRRMGRRASDFTLEILHEEIRSAVSKALEPILPRLEEVQRQLSQMPGQEVRVAEPEPEQRLLELEALLSHQQEARESYRQRLEDSEQANLQLQKQLLQLQQQSQSSAPDPEWMNRALELERVKSDLELRLTRLQEQHTRQAESLQQAQQRLSQELNLERQARMEALEASERVRAELNEHQVASLTMEAERARFSLESRTLQAEIDRLNILLEHGDSTRRELETLQQKLASSERSASDALRVHEEKEQELRRLREQVNSLTYRLQMAGTGSTGPSPEEARKVMEKLADAQAEMAEKNQLINQNYAEIGELRSKLDDSQRKYYELHQRYEKLENEWSQLAAQVAARHMSEHQQQQAPPPPSPDKGKVWGLFGRRDS